MKVIFVPDYRDGNSYQTNLSESLSKLGTSIYLDNIVLKSIIEHWRPDILHIHWPHRFMVSNNIFITIIKSTGFICELVLLKLFGIKIVWTVHNIIDHRERSRYLQLLFNKLFVRLCDRLIVHCISAKVDVENIYNKDPSSIIVIPHGNYIDYYENTITSLSARNKLKLGLEDTIFLCFGHIRSYKGIPELIDTFKRLDNHRAKLLIVGRPLDNRIIANILNSCKHDDNIKAILRYIPDEDIQIYMNAADIIVLPYKNILTSGAVILAMSFGRPIIAPKIKCIADTLDEKGSFLYEGDNLFETMIRALNTDKITLTNMGRHNVILAGQLSWNEIGKRTYDAYKQCLVKR